MDCLHAQKPLIMECTNQFPIPDKNSPNKNDVIYVPCGKCIACRGKLKNEWVIRNKYELRSSVSAIFLTLTYNDENLPLIHNLFPTLNKVDYQKFLKRLRKKDHQVWTEHYKLKNIPKHKWKIPKVRYYLTGEYGDKTFRPHYHAIIYNLHQTTIKHIQEIWGKGHTHTDKAEAGNISYVTSYLMKYQENGHLNKIYKHAVKPYNAMSLKPAIMR